MIRTRPVRFALIAVSLVVIPRLAAAQSSSSRRTSGRISMTADVWTRDGDSHSRQTDLATAITFYTSDADERGLEYGVNLRQSWRLGPDLRRLSVYEGFVGVRLGHGGPLRIRAGHLWLPDLGTTGALAGGLVEFIQPRSDPAHTRIRAGGFVGREPLVFDAGYAPGVTKAGGFVAIERGFMQRHVVGYSRVAQGGLLERSALSLMNFVPIGASVFLYQVAEIDLSGPAAGTGRSGLSYLVMNGRFTLSRRIDLNASYNRGRAVDARSLTDDLRNGRALAPERLEGLLYESIGGRLTVEIARNVRIYGGYGRDRNNRGDSRSDRTHLGGHASNVLGAGFDFSASVSQIDQSPGRYRSTYVSIGKGLGRAIYVSADYATSLSIVQFLRSDGIVVQVHPRMRRAGANASVLLGRRWSVYAAGEFERDDTSRNVRALTSLSVRF